MENLSILIAEDEAHIRKGLVEMLELYFERVFEASDGVEAYQIYQEEYPQIILTDIDMPKLNGLDLVKKIRATDNQTKIILLSAHSKVKYFQEAIPLGLVSYLIKPISSRELRAILQQTIQEISLEEPLTLADNHQWDRREKKLIFEQQIIALTHSEQRLLEVLIDAKGEVVTYSQIQYHLYDTSHSLNAITSLIKRIRAKSSKNLIETCYKEGYRVIPSSKA